MRINLYKTAMHWISFSPLRYILEKKSQHVINTDVSSDDYNTYHDEFGSNIE